MKIKDEFSSSKEISEDNNMSQLINRNLHMNNCLEYKQWCEDHGRRPINGNIDLAKKGEQESEDQKEQRLFWVRKNFFEITINGIKEHDLTEEERKIRNIYLEIDNKYYKGIINKRLEEYVEWCTLNGRVPIEGAGGREKSLFEAKDYFFSKYVGSKTDDILTDDIRRIKKCYDEMNYKYGLDMKNFKTYQNWCEKNNCKPRCECSGKWSGEEQKIRNARRYFFYKFKRCEQKGNLSEDQIKIKELYEKVDEEFDKNMQHFKEYKKWCEEHKRLPMQTSTSKKLENNTQDPNQSLEDQLASYRAIFFRAHIDNKTEDCIKKKYAHLKLMYEELDNKYKKSKLMKNFEVYEAWCEEHGRLPKEINGVRIPKKGEEENETQRETRIARKRKYFYQYYIKDRDESNLSSTISEIKNKYEELDKIYNPISAEDIGKISYTALANECDAIDELIKSIEQEKTLPNNRANK